jgi:hypothetical protein
VPTELGVQGGGGEAARASHEDSIIVAMNIFTSK